MTETSVIDLNRRSIDTNLLRLFPTTTLFAETSDSIRYNPVCINKYVTIVDRRSTNADSFTIVHFHLTIFWYIGIVIYYMTIVQILYYAEYVLYKE